MNILVIHSHTPYSSTSANDALEFTLAASTIADELNVLFTGPGIWQLKRGQNLAALEIKSQEKHLTALPYYDIEQLYVDRTALSDWQLSREDLIDTVVLISQTQIQQLMNKADYIYNF